MLPLLVGTAKKQKKKCSNYNHNSSCERCVERELECEFIQPVLKRGPRKIHVNELNEDDNKIDPFYNNISRDDNISDLHPNGFKDREIFLNMLNELEDDNKIGKYKIELNAVKGVKGYIPWQTF
ncbi:hypothetical protein Glove_384g58 [Diversispora epigaea]|uniref:Zn(2)-C6 fungal-type domain-containing protein n=1 Tax=Diversispora epigaea TaxID=1348612 RepID=A0A397H4V3_9GLOM|nr:hypothetical protein Glove_384g58 [Diversispora epigaea]